MHVYRRVADPGIRHFWAFMMERILCTIEFGKDYVLRIYIVFVTKAFLWHKHACFSNYLFRVSKMISSSLLKYISRPKNCYALANFAFSSNYNLTYSCVLVS